MGPGEDGARKLGIPEQPMLGWLLLALAALARGGTAEPPDFSCFKQCSSCDFLCSWPPRGPAGNTTYVLVLCYATSRTCLRYKAGAATTYTLPRHRVYVLTNTTAWVEARWGPHLHLSPNLTLYLNEAVKLDPPPDGMNFAKAKGLLQLRVPQPPFRGRDRALSREARFRGVGNLSWTQALCQTGKSEDSKEDPVTCDLGGNAAFEVQLRQKTQHWSSYWSDWSKSIFVPEEILESPELSFQLGNLGKNGQRLLQLSWQRAREEQGNVTYTLSTHMPACRCATLPEADEVVLGPEVRAHNLTLCGAEYEILLTATNTAGTSPTRQLHVPPEQHAELSFKDISSTGEVVTVQWEAPSRGFAYCFEQQPLPGAPRRGVCVQQEFPAKSSHLERGLLEAPACYRLAVHGRSAEQGWATFALQHHFAGNTSLASSIHINASAEAAILRWEPSPRATCPGALARYLVCHAAEGDNETYGEADTSASRYTLRNLRPGTAYRVGIQEVAADSGGSCSTPWHFQTMALGPRLAAWKSNLRYLGISLGLPAVAAVIYQLSKRRARQLLFPPLPKPVGSRAIQFSASEMSQDRPWKGFVEPSEKFNLAELLVMEPSPEKEAAGGTRPRTPQPSPKEPTELGQPGCERELPFDYRQQEVLSPLPSPEPAESNGGPTCGTGCSGHQTLEEGVGNSGLPRPLVPLALLISDKPVIIRDEEGSELLQEKSVL